MTDTELLDWAESRFVEIEQCVDDEDRPCCIVKFGTRKLFGVDGDNIRDALRGAIAKEREDQES